MIEPPTCRQYEPGDFLAVRPLNWDEMIDEDDDDENWADSGAPSGARSCPGDDNDNDDDEGEEDTQGGETRTGKRKGPKHGRGNGRRLRMGRGTVRGRGRETVKGKVLLNKPQGEVISLVPLLCSCRRICQRQTWTQRAK